MSAEGAELLRALAVLAEEPDPGHAPVLEVLALGPGPGSAEHADLFLFQLFPWASVYLGAEGQRGGEARDRIAGFWRALGAEAPRECDHLTVLLAAYADLAGRSADVRADHAARAFFWEHLASWLPAYLARVRELGSAFYVRWASLVAETLAAESGRSGPAPEEVPSALREAAHLADPRTEGADAFLTSLLAPARSGLILARDDLRRAACDLELATRPGERTWVLTALLGQSAATVLSWLAGEARRQRGLWEAAFPPGGAREHWRSRAEAAGVLLDELVTDAPSPSSP